MPTQLGWRSNRPSSNIEDVDEDSPLPVQIIAPAYPLAPNYISGSATGGASALTATLAGTLTRTTWIQGFVVAGLGATGASVIAVTVTGLVTTLTFYYTVVAGATTANSQLNVSFNPPVPASDVNKSIVVNVPSMGSGNTSAAVNAWGFQL